MKLALIGFGNVGRALARLLESQRAAFPFRIVAIHTARHGSAFAPDGLPPVPDFGPPAASAGEFLDRAEADVMVELTPLDPATGEPAISHIRAAFARRMHVVTANKGPIAHAYAALRDEARERRRSASGSNPPSWTARRSSTWCATLCPASACWASPASSTRHRRSSSKPCAGAAAWRTGSRRRAAWAIAEADAAYDIDGWDSAAKTAALANVLMDARVTPQQVSTRGIRRLTPERVLELAAKRKTVCLVSRARLTSTGVSLRVRAEVIDETDILASLRGTSNLLLLHTDLMGTIGTVSIAPSVDQTAYGVFSDLADLC